MKIHLDVPAPTVVIADDDGEQRVMLVLLLKRIGFCSIISCASGKLALGEVIELLDRGEPVIVVTDREMPDGDGEELVVALDAERDNPASRFAVIMHSGSLPSEDIQGKLFRWIMKGGESTVTIAELLHEAARHLDSLKKREVNAS